MSANGPIQVDFWYDSDCPHAATAKARLTEALLRRPGTWTIHDHKDGGILSPTVTVNGEDVIAGPSPRGRGCRLEVPTVEQICDALARVDTGATNA